jgi:hypothetical protein
VFCLLEHPRVIRSAFRLVTFRIVITARFQFLDPHLLDSPLLCSFNPVLKSSNPKVTYAIFSHPTPPIGHIPSARSTATILCMPFKDISPCYHLDPLTRHLGSCSSMCLSTNEHRLQACQLLLSPMQDCRSVSISPWDAITQGKQSKMNVIYYVLTLDFSLRFSLWLDGSH